MTVTYTSIHLLFAEGTVVFEKDTVLNANVIQEINPVSTELPISRVEFTVVVLDETLSMFSGSTYSQLAERLPIMVYEYIDAAPRLIGRFYLDTWKNITENKLEFSAVDILGVMQGTDFDGIFFSAATTLPNVLSQVLTPVNFSYNLDSALTAVTLSGWIPPGNYRQALQQILFASGATVTTAGSELLAITPVGLASQLYDYKIKDSQKMHEQSVELLPLVSKIELVSHNYTQGTVLETIFDQYLEAGSYKIVFEKPYYSIIIAGPGYTQKVLGTENGDYQATENGDYIEAGGEYNQGVNSLYLTLESAATVTVTGYPWVDSKQSFTFTETGTESLKNSKSYLISDATLISISNAQTILNSLRDYYRQRYIQEVKLLPSDITLQDIAISNTVYNHNLLGLVHKMDVDLVRGFLAKTSLRGIEPVYVLPSETPVRRVRTGVGISGMGLTYNNKWRQYA